MRAKLAFHTPVCDLLQIHYPISQAGMGVVAYADLAAAVSGWGRDVIAARSGWGYRH